MRRLRQSGRLKLVRTWIEAREANTCKSTDLFFTVLEQKEIFPNTDAVC
jgi:hypothetical protein